MNLTSRRVGKTSPEAGSADALGQQPDSRLPQQPQSPGDSATPKLSEAAQLQEKFRAGPYLVLSSLFFLQPILFANCAGVHHGPVGFVSKFVTVVCFVSCMYWYYPTDGWRLTLDLTMAKASFVVVLVTALLYGEGGMHGCRVLGIIFGAMIVIEYQLSCYFFYRGSRIWPLFHASMHFTGGLNQAICCYIMIRSQISSTQLDTCHLSALDALLQDFNRYLTGPGVVDSFMKCRWVALSMIFNLFAGVLFCMRAYVALVLVKLPSRIMEEFSDWPQRPDAVYTPYVSANNFSIRCWADGPFRSLARVFGAGQQVPRSEAPEEQRPEGTTVTAFSHNDVHEVADSCATKRSINSLSANVEEMQGVNRPSLDEDVPRQESHAEAAATCASAWRRP